jgi:hypothetical protein
MIGEPKPQASADTSIGSKEQQFGAASREDFASNAEQVAVTREAIAEAALAGDFDKAGELAQMAKGLKSDSVEMMSRTEDVARAENAERDAETARKAAEAKVAEDAARAEQAAAHATKEAEDVAKATALAEQIKSGNIGVTHTETSADSVLADEQKVLDDSRVFYASRLENKAYSLNNYHSVKPEHPVSSEDLMLQDARQEDMELMFKKIGAPKTEMFEKYGERMRNAASALVGAMKEWRAHDDKTSDETLDMAERLKAQEIRKSLNERIYQLSRDASFGAEVIAFRRQKRDESWSEYHSYREKTCAEYKSTAMQDPQIVLNLAEAGQLGNGYRENEGIGQIDGKLRENLEFMQKVLETLSRKGAEAFFVHVQGKARTRELYIASVKKNHLNYQWGPKEWATDPEIQKIALESGLDPMYLKKN